MDVFKTLLLDTPATLANVSGVLPIVNGGTNATTAADARTNLGLGTAAVVNLGTGVATFLTTPSSANLAAALTDETGTGAVVFATSPTLVTPSLGTPSALVGTNITGTASGLTAGNVTTNANLTGAITSVGNATSLGSFTSANLASALTDETGSGANVFATSPTLVTPNLGTPSALVGTNITGTAAAFNINGTVGATTPSTGAFTTLSATGALSATSLALNGYANFAIDLSSSSAASSLIKYKGSTGDTWQAGAGTLNVGDWGVTNATRSVNPIVITGGTTSPTTTFYNNSGAQVGQFSSTGLAVTGALSSTTGANFATSSGSVGIGTASPSSLLHINNGEIKIQNSDYGRVVFVRGSTTVWSVGPRTTDDLYIYREGGSGNVIFNDGNVGIGTSSPAYKLDVAGQSNLNGIRIGLNGDTINASGNLLAFQGNGTERMRIDTSGNLLVGTTNTDPTFNRVNGLVITSGGRLYSRSSGTWDFGLDSTSGIHVSFYTDNGARVTAGSISSSSVTTLYNTTSDYRLKFNVSKITNSGAFVDALKPCQFDWADGKHAKGFIAHEFAEVSPSSVCGEKDALDEKGEPKYQSMQASSAEVIANLVAELQSVRQRLAALETK